MKTSIQKKEQNTTLNASKKQTRPPMNTVGLDSDDRASIREILSKQALQPKLKISQPNDKYEQEADRVAEQVMRMPDSVVAQGGEGVRSLLMTLCETGNRCEATNERENQDNY